MNRLFPIIFAACLAFGISALIAPRLYARLDRYAVNDFGSMPAFEFEDAGGGRITSAALKSKLTVINFFFTSCGGICPMVSSNVARLYRDYTGQEALHFVSISVDPDTDTAPVLRQYAAKFGADLQRWRFLRGSHTDVAKLLDGLKLGGGESAAQHTSRMVLVDSRARVRGYYIGTDADSVQLLRRDIDALLAKP